MEFQTVIEMRKMVRSFSTRPIEQHKLDRIIENIFSGPSAGYSQGTEIIILETLDAKELFYKQWGSKEERSDYTTKWPNLENAPVIILILSNEVKYQERYNQPDKSGLDENATPWWYVDAGMAILLGLLTSVDVELVAALTGIKSQKYMRENFGIPKHLDIVGALSIGYQKGKYRPSKSVLREKRPLEEIVHYNSW